MKISFLTVIGLFLGIVLFPNVSIAQNLTGIWKGYFITKDYSQYKVEIQLKQVGNNLSGVSYSYLNTVYYGKATLSGNLQEDAHISVQELKTVEVKASEGSVNCLMNYSLNYSKSGREEYLEGSFTSKYETESQGIRKGEDCGGGKVYLRRVTSSDFYPEPFLQNSTAKKVVVNEAPPSKKAIVTNTKNTPEKKSTPIVSNTATLLSKSLKEDQPIASLPAKTAASIPAVSNNRLNNLLKELTVSAPHVKVFLYDNGEVDGDTVSVFLNSKQVLFNKRLSTVPLELTLQLDPENSIQEITVVAENLGRIPPNSALMIVEAGEQRYRVQITSTEQKNAVVRFRYESNKP
jgi:hypothetical protein